MNTFKLIFSEDNIRRIRLETPNYAEFITLLQDLYPKFHPELTIKYMDSDGDKISVDSEFEWSEMMLEMQGESAIKLWIDEKQGGYFKDGPTPEAVKIYVNEITKEGVEIGNEFFEQLKENVPQCIASLFKGGKIIPTHIPEFLKPAFSMQYIKDNVVDLDVNVPELFDLLHARALSLLNSVDVKDLEAGRDYLVATLRLVPDNMIALYNLACAESLLGNTQNALHYLEKAVTNGFKDIDHMIADSDLANIHNTEAFQNLIAKISEQFTPSQPEETVTEIPVVVVEPEVVVEEPEVQLSESIAPLKDTYGEQLTLLNEMGFTADPDVLLLLLEQFNGNVDSVMQFLLGFQ